MRILSLLFVLLLACAGAAPHAMAQQWVEYESPTGRYRVDMPGPPVVTPVELQLPNGGTTSGAQALVQRDEAAYLAGHTDFPPGALSSAAAQQVLAGVRDSSATGHRLVSDRTFSNSGYPAREYVIERSDGAMSLTRTALARNRLIQIIAIYGADNPEPLSVRRFVNSFTILPQ